jgi:hypothetical protein
VLSATHPGAATSGSRCDRQLFTFHRRAALAMPPGVVQRASVAVDNAWTRLHATSRPKTGQGIGLSPLAGQQQLCCQGHRACCR